MNFILIYITNNFVPNHPIHLHYLYFYRMNIRFRGLLLLILKIKIKLCNYIYKTLRNYYIYVKEQNKTKVFPAAEILILSVDKKLRSVVIV